MSAETLNYYEVLDVSSDANRDHIFEAYKKAQNTFSLSNPELYNIFNEAEAKDWLELIEEAYAVVGFPNTRRVYDNELGLHLPSAMPSFELENSSVESKSQTATELNPGESPRGYGNTSVSQYSISSSMEKMIEKQELFDGLFLKKVREYKNIDLTDFSKTTCIAIRHLYAIENNNFSVLPAIVFVRGYIIQYCRMLHLDEKKVVSSFMSLLKND